jgi:hypothetical protein
MDDNESLRTIAAELRQLARAGYGFPPAVRVKVDNLVEIAGRLEKIADAHAQSPLRLQARVREGVQWIDIFPAQVEAMSKAGHALRAIETESKIGHLDAGKN